MKLALRTLLAIAVLSLTGCIAPYFRYPFDVLVIDAETGEPIKNALVTAGSSGDWVINTPEDRTAYTDEQGRAKLQVAQAGMLYTGISVTKDGYLPTSNSVHQNESEFYPELGRTPFLTGSGRSNIVYLFRPPVPMIVIELQSGFRGPVALEITGVDSLTARNASQRDLVIRIREQNPTQFTIPSVFAQHFYMRFRFADAPDDEFLESPPFIDIFESIRMPPTVHLPTPEPSPEIAARQEAYFRRVAETVYVHSIHAEYVDTERQIWFIGTPDDYTQFALPRTDYEKEGRTIDIYGVKQEAIDEFFGK